MQNVVVKKLTCKGTLRQVFICLGPPSLQGFVGSESVQIKSVKLLRIWSPTELNNSHPPPRHTLCTSLYCSMTQGKGGKLNRREG